MTGEVRVRLGTAVSSRARINDVIEQAELVESLGYDTVWLPEISGRDAFVTAAVLARHTTSLRIALGVVPVPSRGLPALAMAAAAVAESAPGRFVLGLGAGHPETAVAQFGWPGAARPAQVKEVVRALHNALRDGRVQGSCSGGAVNLQLRGVYVDTPPPIIVGALRPAMTRMAGHHADGILLNWVPADHVRRVVPLARAVAGERDFHVACYVPVCVADDGDDVRAGRAAVARQLGSYLRLRAYGDLLAAQGFADEVAAVRDAHGDADERAAAVPERLIDAVAVIGDVATVQAGLDRYRSAGVDEPVLAPVAIGDDPAASLAATWAALAPRT